jgi:virginiamycin B lyase
MRRLTILAALLVVGCSACSSTSQPQSFSQPMVKQKQPFETPWLVRKLTRNTWPNQMAVGVKWYIWVADRGAQSITRIDLRGGARQFPVNIVPVAVMVGPDQNIWLASGLSTVARVTPGGSETDYAIPPSGAKVAELVDGSDGAIWFSVWTESQGGIGRLDTSGNYTFYPLGYTASPLTAGPDGNLWFMDGANLNAINTQGQIVAQYPFTGNASYSSVGPDGAMWFTAGSTIYRVTTQGQISTIQAPVGVGVNDITNWSGRLWMTSGFQGGSALISFDPVSETWGTPVKSPEPLKRIIVGQDGNFWLTGMSASVVTYVNQVLTINPTSIQLKLGGGKDGSATLDVSETNYNGTWIAEWDPAIVNVVQTSPGIFTATAVGPGTGKITINDTMRNFSKIPVTVQ